MKKIKDISEDEMISVFLRTEINSNRWSKFILSLLKKDGKNRNIIDNPDLSNQEENMYRKDLLGNYRGYGGNSDLFTGFPDDVNWIRAKINKEELKKVKYMRYSYWDKLSKYTRFAKVGAETIRKGTIIFNESNEGFLKTAEVLKQGKQFPEMILVGKDERSELVVLERHQRITAYFLAPDKIPEQLKVIIGFSSNMTQWSGY